MPVIDHFFALGWMRKAIWRMWYPFLTRRLRGEGVLFLNYAFETEPPMNIPLAAADEPNRACIQLYHHVAALVSLIWLNTVKRTVLLRSGNFSFFFRHFSPPSGSSQRQERFHSCGYQC